MNARTTLPARPLSNPNLTAKSETPSTTTASPNQLDGDHPCPKLPSADWTSVKVLTLDEVRDRYILWMLDRCGGNREETALFLGIGRSTLYRYLKKGRLRKTRWWNQSTSTPTFLLAAAGRIEKSNAWSENSGSSADSDPGPDNAPALGHKFVLARFPAMVPYLFHSGWAHGFKLA
jgi:Bacterial regulatory protein, Fis family